MSPQFPAVQYPTIVDGLVSGKKLRMESFTGKEIVLGPGIIRLYWPKSFHDGDNFVLKDAGPINIGADTYGICHQQKYSPSGWLKAEPDCYHRWVFWHGQEVDGAGNWKPGTESGIYLRKSRVLFRMDCWRWDVAGTMIDGVLRHWIPSRGYLGGHWD